MLKALQNFYNLFFIIFLPLTVLAQQQKLISDLGKELKNQGTNFYYPPFISPIPAINGKVILSLNGEVGVTDGTVQGTKIIKDLNNNASQKSDPFLLGSINGLTIFAGNDGVHGYEL